MFNCIAWKKTLAQVLEALNDDTHYAHIPTVIWSTSNAGLCKELCKKHGAKEYFQKPHRFDEVVQLSQKMLR